MLKLFIKHDKILHINKRVFEREVKYNMTEKKLEKVEFGFENIESGEVSGDAIQEMKIVGLHQVGHRDFNDGYVSFTENLEADSFLIELDYEMANQNLTDTDEPVGERLHAYNDIVDVTLYFEDGTSETINLPWLELRRDENDWQSSELRANRPLNKETLGRMSPDLAKAMQRIEKDDRFMNRKILTVHVNKDK